jgi:hypothetical protein
VAGKAIILLVFHGAELNVDCIILSGRALWSDIFDRIGLRTTSERGLLWLTIKERRRDGNCTSWKL